MMPSATPKQQVHRQTRDARARATTLALALIALVTLGSPASGEDLIGLYLTWSRDPTTTITVNWVDLYAHSSASVLYRQVDADHWSQSEAKRSNMGPSTLQLRRVELNNLQPGALYEFGIGDRPTEVSHFWRFRTMSAEMTRPLRFVAGGDMMHDRAMVDRMNRQMQRLDPDFALLLGDLAYENGELGARWIDWLQSWRQYSVAKGKRLIPMVIGIGNHEVKGGYDGKIPDDAPYFYSLFALPCGRSYYALDFGRYLSLIVMDSEHTHPIEGPQADWLEQALSERAGQQFLFAGYHYPAYGTTKAPRGGLPIDAPRSVAIRKHWVPHLERYGASAIFENDHHNFKRTHRLRKHRRDDKNGLLYLGDGAWGVRPREVPSPEVGWWLAKAEPRNHLWEIEMRPQGTASLRAVDASGEVFDEVELKQPRTTPVP